MQQAKFKRTWVNSAILASFCVVNLAHADDNTAEDAGAAVSSDASGAGDAVSDTKVLETVTVIADQRKVDLQKAAQSVTAISDEVLQQANITDATDLNGHVPGVTIAKSGGGEKMINIRGVGSQTPENFFTQPGVSFHMDGAYITNSIALNMGFLDVDHIEVQRGPQGTVFGAASTGGTMNVISKKPVLGVYSGDIEAGFGNYNYSHSKAAVNIPVGESVAVRAVVEDLHHDGYAQATSIPGGYDLDDADNTNARVTGLWQIADDLKWTLSYQHYIDNHNGEAMKNLDDPDPDPRRLTQDFPAKFNMSMDVANSILTWELPFATVKSTTSYQSMDVDQSYDSDRLDIATYGSYDHVATWSTWATTITQELTMTSNPGNFVDWVGGIFYLHSSSGQYVVEYKGTDADDDYTYILPRDGSVYPSTLSYENLSHVKRTSWAPFAQATVNFTDAFRLTLGARYNDDDYSGTSSSYYSDPSSVDFGDHVTTGKVALEYDLTKNNMAYTSWSRGYKPGGVNGEVSQAMDVQPTYETETVGAYEIGLKNRFLDNKATFNVAGFYSKYDDMQYLQSDPVPYMDGIGNIPKADIWGVETEGAWLTAGGHLQFSMNATYQDGKFPVDYYALDAKAAAEAADAAVAAGVVPYTDAYYAARASAEVDVKGNTPAYLAKFSGTLAGTWYQDIGSLGLITTRLELVHRGDYEARIFNAASIDHVPSYNQGNLFLQYEPANDPWKVWLTVTNLTNRAGIAGRFIDPYGSAQVSNSYIAPRQYVANFGYTF